MLRMNKLFASGSSTNKSHATTSGLHKPDEGRCMVELGYSYLAT